MTTRSLRRSGETQPGLTRMREPQQGAITVNGIVTTTKQLPKWVSHKEIWGDKIIKIVRGAANVGTELTGDTWIIAEGCAIPVTTSLVARSEPVVGDYYVKYADGYQSWSPAKAFEEGYTRL